MPLLAYILNIGMRAHANFLYQLDILNVPIKAITI